MKKSEFKEIALECIERNAVMEIGDVKLNGMMIYNPRVNGGRGYRPLGDGSKDKIVDRMWIQAKKTGFFTYKDRSYDV